MCLPFSFAGDGLMLSDHTSWVLSVGYFNNLKISMKKIMRMLSTFALLAVVSLSACKDDPEPETCQNGTFEATVNGGLASGSSFDNTLLKGGGAKRMDIRATDANGRQLIISISDQST